MVAKRFHISCPAEMSELGEYIKSVSSVPRIISIWSTARRNKGTTRWDHAFYAGFCGTRKRDARIYRIAADGEMKPIATLQYNKALNWCEQHLRPVYD